MSIGIAHIPKLGYELTSLGTTRLFLSNILSCRPRFGYYDIAVREDALETGGERHTCC
jgi:hypothetical protein